MKEVKTYLRRRCIKMDLLIDAAANKLRKTGEKKKLSIKNQINNNYDVYEIPLDCLYYNDQNGRINTLYKKYSATNGIIKPEPGDSEYNKIFEQLIYESNPQAMEITKQSINEKSQQEPGVVLSDGRVIDGNRRFTALRMLERERHITQCFNAVILPLDAECENDKKLIKELELDLQLGHEEKVRYDPIDSIFDTYNTIHVEKIMSMEEYKKASGETNTRKINQDIKLAELIIKFIEIVSPGGNAIDKFYLARDLKLDGPIEEIQRAVDKLKSDNKETAKDAILTYLIASKAIDKQNDATRIMRDFKKNIINDSNRLQYFLDSADDKVDIIMDTFKENPIQSANELKTVIETNNEAKESIVKLLSSTERLINKRKFENERIKALIALENVSDSLSEIDIEDFSDLKDEERLEAKQIMSEIREALFKIQKEL